MKFLEIETDNQPEIKDLNDYIDDRSKKIFIFVHMDGCGHCITTIPEWDKLKEKFKESDDNLIIVKLNSSLQGQIGDYFKDLNTYPSFNYISNKKAEEYSGGRELDAFASWINSKMKAQKGGGWSRTMKRSKKNKSKNKSKNNKTTRRRRQRRKTNNNKRYSKRG